MTRKSSDDAAFRWIVRALALCVAASTAIAAWSAEADDPFETPSKFLGRDVTVCGFFHQEFEDSNVWKDEEAQRTGQNGLGFIARQDAAKLHLKRACVRGTIVRTGCAEEKICTWSSYPFALKAA